MSVYLIEEESGCRESISSSLSFSIRRGVVDSMWGMNFLFLLWRNRVQGMKQGILKSRRGACSLLHEERNYYSKILSLGSKSWWRVLRKNGDFGWTIKIIVPSYKYFTLFVQWVTTHRSKEKRHLTKAFFFCFWMIR